MKRLLIIGAGGHGMVVADTALETQLWDDICFLDDAAVARDLPYKIVGTIGQLPGFVQEFSGVIVAIGDNKKREELLLWATNLGCTIATIIHPKAFVSSRFVMIEKGVVVFAQAAINAYAKIGFGSIVNTGSIIEHDSVLGSCVHVSPGSALAGGVTVGKYSWIGIGSSVIEEINIGKNSVVGAGSVVINDLSDNVIAVGNPAKVIKQNER